MLGPDQLLLAAVDPHQGPVDQGQELGRQLRGQLHGPALAEPGAQRRLLEPGLVGLVLDLGGQAQALGVGPADPGHPGRVEDPAGEGEPHQRDHLQLVLAHRLVRRRPGEPHRLQHPPQVVQGDPGLGAHLPVGPVSTAPPSGGRGRLQERERQPARPDGRGDPVHRQPGPLAGHGQAELVQVTGEERGRPVPGDQDAEVHHPADLGLAGAGQPGQAGRGERVPASLHAAILRRRPWLGDQGGPGVPAGAPLARLVRWSRCSRRCRSRSRASSRPSSSAGCQPRTPVARSTTMATRRRVQWSEANPWARGGCWRAHLTAYSSSEDSRPPGRTRSGPPAMAPWPAHHRLVGHRDQHGGLARPGPRPGRGGRDGPGPRAGAGPPGAASGR